MSELKWQLILLAALAAVSPVVYAYIQATWGNLVIEAGNWIGIEGKIPWRVLLVLTSVSGVFLVAALLAFPLGYFTANRAAFFGGFLSLAPLSFLLWTVKDGWTGPTFLRMVQVTEYLSIVIAFIVLAKLGAHFRMKEQTAS